MMEEKLVEMGYKTWEKGDMKRIYINDFREYFEVEECEKQMNRKVFIVNGISAEQASTNVQREVASLVSSSLPVKVYYDCKDDSFHFSGLNSTTAKKIVNSAINKLKEELEG